MTKVKAQKQISLDQDGTSLNVEKLRDRWVLISLWATWCSACKIQIPDLNRLYQRRDKNQLHIVGITYDWEISAATQPSLEDLGKRFDISYPILAASKDNLRWFPKDPEIPTSLLLRPGGKVYAMHIGLLTDKMVLATIRKNS